MPVSETSLANLKKSVHGQPSRNPAGRPKLPDLNAAIARVLGRVDPDTLKTGLEEIVEGLRKKAARGDSKAAKVLLDRGWGMPKQAVSVSFEPTVIDFKDVE